MTAKKKLILYPSVLMDRNKKEDRNEHGLVRMSASARSCLGFSEDNVEVWTAGNETAERVSVLLDIFQAYSKDVKKIKQMVQKGELKPGDAKRVAFVTTKMYNRITGGQASKTPNIWISTGVHDTIMGADPEFLLFNSDGNIVHANSVMNKIGKIGCDGAMAEVRPDPAATPAGLVKSIRNCFSDKALTAAITPYSWVTSCYYKNTSRDYPVGGHLHFGNPTKVARMPLPKRELLFNVLNKIIDELLAIPCIRLDGELGNLRRTKCQMCLNNNGGWGYFGEWRTHRGRYEHRTLSGMWLLHPVVAQCVFGTAKAISDGFLQNWAEHGYEYAYVLPNSYIGLNKSDMNHDSFKSWNEFPVCVDMGATMSSKEIRTILNNSKGGDITKSWLNNWHNNLKKFPTYKQFSKEIRGLKEILSINMSELEKWDKSIQKNWLGSKKFIVNL